MKRFASSKTELAGELQVTRQTVYAVLKMHGCPKVRSDGRYCVAEFRQFLNRIKHDVKTNEKAQLELSLLNLKVRRAETELQEFEQGLRDEITKEAKAIYLRFWLIIIIYLDRLPGECAPVLEGLPVGEIRSELTHRLNAMKEKYVAEIQGLKDERESVIVPFEAAAG